MFPQLKTQIKQEKLSFSDVEDTNSETDDERAAVTETTSLDIKQEKSSGSESEKDQERAKTLAIKREKASDPEDDNIRSSRDDEINLDSTIKEKHLLTLLKQCQKSAFSNEMETKLRGYLNQFPNIGPISGARDVALDLTDPDEEAWVIQCPASVDPCSVLLNTKLNLSLPRSLIKKCSMALETNVRTNVAEDVISVLSGSRVKSFIPAGFVRIIETLPRIAEPQMPNTNSCGQVQVPFPEELRVRHPLLGYDYQAALEVPKQVQKRLSAAQQKSDYLYSSSSSSITSKKTKKTIVKLEPDVEMDSNDLSLVADKKKKRKEIKKEPIDGILSPSQDKNAVESSPLKKRQRKNVENDVQSSFMIKKEPQNEAEEDDILWLLNI